LVHMYDQLDEACRTTTRQLAGYLTLLQVNFVFFNMLRSVMI